MSADQVATNPWINKMKNTPNDFARQDTRAHGAAADLLASYMPKHDCLGHETIHALAYLPGGWPWALSPYGWWDERDGSAVVFDRAYRPIARVSHDCTWVSIVPPDDRIDWIEENTYYRYLDAPQLNGETRHKIMAVTRALGIGEEIARRHHLESLGKLPTGYTGGGQ